MNIQFGVRKTIERYGMLSTDGGVLLAVSGGPDSIALLHLMAEFREESGLRLAAAHLMHGIRGEEAEEDARFVAAAAQTLGVPCHIKEVDLPKMRSRRGKGNMEAMAREERYDFFTALAGQLRLGAVATAHTRDDQVETLLMWLLRGSGRRGLGGLPPVRRLPAPGPGREKVLLIRPLIETSRQQILQYLARRGVSYRADRTNYDETRLRNWIRLRLLPQLKERGGAGLDERLASLAELLREEESVLHRLATDRLREMMDGDRLSRAALQREERAMQRRLLRLWLERTRGSLRSISFDHVEKMRALMLEGPPQGRLSLPGEWVMVRDYETVGLEKKSDRAEPVSYSYALPLEGVVSVPEAGMKITTSRHAYPGAAWLQGDLEEIFDLSALRHPLTVRSFRRGDRFQPLGMEGHKKIKDLFIEQKVPRRIRASLPLLLAGSEILWIPGYGRSAAGRVGSETLEVLKIKLEFEKHDPNAG